MLETERGRRGETGEVSGRGDRGGVGDGGGRRRGERGVGGAYLPPQDAVHHDDNEALQRVEDGEEDLEEGGAPVGDGEHGGHPGECQQGEHHTRAPQGRPAGTHTDQRGAQLGACR